jgi:hypothetical protein
MDMMIPIYQAIHEINQIKWGTPTLDESLVTHYKIYGVIGQTCHKMLWTDIKSCDMLGKVN